MDRQDEARPPATARSAATTDESAGSSPPAPECATSTASGSSARTTRRRGLRRRRSPAVAEPGSESSGAAYDGAAVLHLEIRQLRADYGGIRASDPVAEARLLASIAREGQKVPIIVVREGDTYQVLDGFRRRNTLEQLGRDIVLAVEWPTGPVDGLVEVRRLRSASASGPLEEGWLIEVLVERHGLSLDEIGRRLGRTRSWVHRRLSLVRQLPEKVRLKVLSGALSGYVATKYAVPLARSNAELVAPYCDCVIAHGLSTREAGVVYQYLARTTDPVIQKEILAHPQRVLEPSDRAGGRTGAATQGLDAVDRLEGWCRHTGGIHGRLTRLLAQGTSDDVIERIAVLWNAHREIARAVWKQLDDLAALAPAGAALARANTSAVPRTEDS